MPLPTAIYSAAQVRDLDDYAIQHLGVQGYTLMKRAGEASLRALRTRWPVAYRIVIVCGGGNNGGDGYVLARFAQAAGLSVTALAAVPVEQLQGDAARAAEDFQSSAGVIEPFTAERLRQGEVIVDALLGIGVKGPQRPAATAVIRAINAAGKPVLSLDVPSGLDPDRGMPLGDDAVRAECTLTFIGLKVGLFVGDGPEYVGTLYFDDLEIQAPEAREFSPRVSRLTDGTIAQALPRRRRASHKGTYGKVLVIGGAPGMPGAARLAAEAALRTGAGLVTVATAPENVAAIAAGCPEAILAPFSDAGKLREPIERADVIAIGPGLGRSQWAHDALRVAVSAGKPIVVDADALNIIAEDASLRHPDWILTPHPGEAARLLTTSVEQIQADRVGALEALLRTYRGTIVLKGAGTLVGQGGRVPSLCERGNPGMASAGMGDVLTGVIAGVLAQTRDALVAAKVGVLAHALAGDAAARNGERGLLARDVLAELRTWLNL